MRGIEEGLTGGGGLRQRPATAMEVAAVKMEKKGRGARVWSPARALKSRGRRTGGRGAVVGGHTGQSAPARGRRRPSCSVRGRGGAGKAG
jgi:hypothetical protein